MMPFSAMRLAAGVGGGGDPILSLFAAGEKGAWWDASDFSVMFQDTAGTSPVTATGQTVRRINDKSGNGAHITNTTGWVLNQDGNGHYYLQGASRGFSTISAMNLSGTDKISVIVAAEKANDTVQSLVVNSPNYATNAGAFRFGPGSGTYRVDVRGDTGDAVSKSCARNITGISTTSLDITAFCLDMAQTTRATVINPVYLDRAVPTMTDAGILADPGSGNFGNFTVCVGSNSALTGELFTGKFYAMIIRGALSTEAQLFAACDALNEGVSAYLGPF